MKKDLILFVNAVPENALKAVKEYSEKTNQKLELAVIRDAKNTKNKIKGVKKYINCDLKKNFKIAKALKPYQERLLVIVCRSDKNILDFAKIIPHVPYLRTPTSESLVWSTDKISTRRHLYYYDKNITPFFAVVKDNSKQSIQKIKEKLNFPVVVKPSGLASSLLVSICYHQEELERNLTKVFKKITSVYKENGRKAEPKVLVEEFMEGEMYSIDAYINSRGKIDFCPLVHVKTGKSIGFDDFFGYQRITPTILKKNKIEKAEEVTKKAIYALGLRNITVHIELLKTVDGFKIIEINPRMGGFRHEMYQLSFGINHILNDILIRIPKKITIPKKVKGYTAVLRFYPKKEGKILKITGLQKIKKLVSFVRIKQSMKTGEFAKFAKNGGKGVCDITLFNKNRPELLADIRRIEESLKIFT